MEDSLGRRMKQGFAACIMIGVVLISGFVIFQEWGYREWPVSREASGSCEDVEKTGAGHFEQKAAEPEKTSGRPALTLLLWNVHNYGVAGENGLIAGMSAPKKKEEADALVTVLAGQRADVLALVEVNSRFALDDLKSRLRGQGLDYPHDEFLKREGQMRGMALLSRFPLSARDSRAEVPLRNVAGAAPGESKAPFMMRGILSVTVQCPGGDLDVGVVHLKSRVGEQSGQEGLIRRAEADKVREWVAEKKKSFPAVPLILCGDFNDTPDSPAIRSLSMEEYAGVPLKRLPARDSRGETWTQYYKEAETYALFDYVFYSSSRRSQRLSASLVDDLLVRKASDHRPVVVKINKS